MRAIGRIKGVQILSLSLSWEFAEVQITSSFFLGWDLLGPTVWRGNGGGAYLSLKDPDSAFNVFEDGPDPTS